MAAGGRAGVGGVVPKVPGASVPAGLRETGSRGPAVSDTLGSGSTLRWPLAQPSASPARGCPAPGRVLRPATPSTSKASVPRRLSVPVAAEPQGWLAGARRGRL